MPKKRDDGWYVDIRPNGRNGSRVRKTFLTKAEALRYEAWVKGKANQGEWNPDKPDNRRLKKLIDKWYELHGSTLKKGRYRLSEFTRIVAILDNPIARTLSPADFAAARSKRLVTVGIETANRDLVNLCSVYNKLHELKEINYPNPLASVKKLKVPQRELTYLTDEQVAKLLTRLDESKDSHARITARICLATGARWGEAATVKAQQVVNNKITFSDTKNGRTRTLPISKKLSRLILDHAPLIDGINTFERVVDEIKLTLPKGQLTHVLRHTFASHYMIKGGDIRALSKALDHSDLNLTIRYAHLAPDHMHEILELNPLVDTEF